VRAHFALSFCEGPSFSRACHGTLARDVSAGGVRFYSESFLPHDTKLLLEFSLPEEKEPIKTLAKITWMRSLPNGYRFEIGTEFTDLSPRDRTLLESLTPRLP